MTTDDNVTIDEVVKTLYKMCTRYEKVNRTQKGQLLDEIEAIPTPPRAGMNPCVFSAHVVLQTTSVRCAE